MKKMLIKCTAVIIFMAFSFGVSAKIPVASLPMCSMISFLNEDLSDKLAADAKFTELINLVGNTESKIRTLSLEDKKLFKKYAEEKNLTELSNLYFKCGIDYKKISSQKMAIISELEKKYDLNKRIDKKEVINSALIKIKTPFGNCLAGLMIGMLGCDAFSGDYYLYCVMSIEALYLGCIFALD